MPPLPPAPLPTPLFKQRRSRSPQCRPDSRGQEAEGVNKRRQQTFLRESPHASFLSRTPPRRTPPEGRRRQQDAPSTPSPLSFLIQFLDSEFHPRGGRGGTKIKKESGRKRRRRTKRRRKTTKKIGKMIKNEDEKL